MEIYNDTIRQLFGRRSVRSFEEKEILPEVKEAIYFRRHRHLRRVTSSCTRYWTSPTKKSRMRLWRPATTSR